jgi:endonuclease YncB( thermonuclease family)
MLLLVAILVAAATLQAHAADVQTLSARVVGVHNGDTLTALTDDNRQFNVRLHGIDAPELGQPFGWASKQALSELVFGKQVTLQTTGTDRYKRTLARVTLGDIEVDAQMIATGHAWHYKKYDKTAVLNAAERNARAARRGLWADAEPVPPCEWWASERNYKARVTQWNQKKLQRRLT